MSKITSPYRYDFVGSFLRPENLKQARKDFKAGKINREQLTTIEDEAVRDLVKPATTSSLTASTAENTGTSTSCGDLTA